MLTLRLSDVQEKYNALEKNQAPKAFLVLKVVSAVIYSN